MQIGVTHPLNKKEAWNKHSIQYSNEAEKRKGCVVALVEQEEVKGQKTGTNFSVACPTTYYIKHSDTLYAIIHKPNVRFSFFTTKNSKRE